MKNKSYVIGLIVIIVVFGFLTFRMVSKKIQSNTVIDEDRHRVAAEEYVEMKTIGKAPEFSFTDQNGETITNKDYEGKVYVAEFFFTTCPSICPIMNRNMIKVQDHFLTNDDFAIASFSIDPEHDTPEVLKKYAEGYGVVNENWHFLTGKGQNEVFDLANTGFNIYVGEGDASNGGFEHSGLFALIDKKGNIVSRLDENGNPIIYYDGLKEEELQKLITDIGIELKK
ncbi:SCO family protein [Neptunitalea lumnitzerae]|uniref:Photosynthetic protein synthase II n=1 Tax=Neptunitalea lumnitzerae TaxID=2965509 RepID=A0ABQ5MNU4_9FLAO|nr:SCO family protein [Neptunitalea sp. Y10]GLB50667.1 photosynthetic protein synthase II [Neptunitalea sp. Y10]